jgi:hypothetical protein
MSTAPDGPPDRDEAATADATSASSHHDGSGERLQTEPAQPTRSDRARASSRALGHAFVRMIATSGIVGIAVGLAAIMGSQKVASWIIGLVASTLSVLLAALIWSSRPS